MDQDRIGPNYLFYILEQQGSIIINPIALSKSQIGWPLTAIAQDINSYVQVQRVETTRASVLQIGSQLYTSN